MHPQKQAESTRRIFLKSTAAVGVAGLAGCVGGGSEDEESEGEESGDEEHVLRVATSTSTTAAFAAAQGMTAVVNENTDNLFAEAQSTQGTSSNVGHLQEDESDLALLLSPQAYHISEGNEPYNNLDFEVQQVNQFYNLNSFFVTNNTDWTSVTDIEEGATLSANVRGAALRESLVQALEYSGLTEGEDYELVSEEHGEQASAMSEGRLDVGWFDITNDDVPGWAQEMMSTEEVNVLEFPDEAIEGAEDDPLVIFDEFDLTEISALDDLAYAPDTMQAVITGANLCARDDIEDDAIYEWLTTLHENRENMGQYHAILEPFADEEWFVSTIFETMPFHSAAADFYEEIGLWQDEWESR